MLQWEHSAILSTLIKLPFSIKTFVLSIFKRPLNAGFTVLITNVLIKPILYYLNDARAVQTANAQSEHHLCCLHRTRFSYVVAHLIGGRGHACLKGLGIFICFNDMHNIPF